MTKLYVEEYVRGTLASGPGGALMQAAEGPPIAEYIIDYATGEAHGANLNAKTRFLRIHADSICVRKVGAEAVAAVTGGGRMDAGQTEYMGVSQTEVIAGTRVSAITTT